MIKSVIKIDRVNVIVVCSVGDVILRGLNFLDIIVF